MWRFHVSTVPPCAPPNSEHPNRWPPETPRFSGVPTRASHRGGGNSQQTETESVHYDNIIQYHTISIPQLECVKRSQASGFGCMLHTSKSHSTECLDSTEMSVLKQIVEVQVSCNLAVGAMHTLGLSEFSHPYRYWSDDGGYDLQHTDRTLITPFHVAC